MDVPQFIQLPAEGHLRCFQVLAVMDKAAVNFYVQGFMWFSVSFHLIITPWWNEFLS